jgi:hypothetical protein
MFVTYNEHPYSTPSPDTPPYGLLPNMSESSGSPGREQPGALSLHLNPNSERIPC